MLKKHEYDQKLGHITWVQRVAKVASTEEPNTVCLGIRASTPQMLHEEHVDDESCF